MLGKTSPRRVAVGGAHHDVPAPLDAHVALVVARGLDDASLDEHLWRLGVEGPHQLLDVVELVHDVPDDEHVGALVDAHAASLGEQLLHSRRELRGRGVAHRNQACLEGGQLLLLLLSSDGGLALLLQGLEGGDANEVAAANHAESLGLEDHVEGLVPGDVPHADGDLAAHVVGGDDVHPTHVGEEPEDVVDVSVLEVEVDAPAGVTAAAAGGPHLQGHVAHEASDVRGLHGDAVDDGSDVVVGVFPRDGPGARARGRALAGREHPDDAVAGADGRALGARDVVHLDDGATLVVPQAHGADEGAVAAAAHGAARAPPDAGAADVHARPVARAAPHPELQRMVHLDDDSVSAVPPLHRHVGDGRARRRLAGLGRTFVPRVEADEDPAGAGTRSVPDRARQLDLDANALGRRARDGARDQRRETFDRDPAFGERGLRDVDDDHPTFISSSHGVGRRFEGAPDRDLGVALRALERLRDGWRADRRSRRTRAQGRLER